MDFNRLAATSARLLTQNGAPTVLSRVLPGDYDPSVGEVDDNGTRVYNTTAVRGAYRLSEIDGTLILSSDVRLFVSPLLATEPMPGDRIAFDGVSYLVVTSRPVKPGTIAVLHDVQCRNA